MRVIIPGGTGLIGKALAKDLANDGHEVILLSRNPRPDAFIMPGIRLEKWDGCTSEGWGWLADGADVIVNLAGENLSAGRWTQKQKRVLVESRVNAGTAITEAIQKAAKKPQILIQSSGVGYYGTSELGVFTEDAPAAHDFLGDLAKAWEASTKPAEEMGVRRVVLRMGVAFSTQSGALPRLLLPFKLFVGGPLGTGRQILSWVHLDDLVRSIRFLIDTPEASGAFNISAEPLTNRQLARKIGKVMHRPAFIPVPAFILRLLLGEMGTVVLEGQAVSAKRLTDLGFRFRFPDAEAALMDLLR